MHCTTQLNQPQKLMAYKEQQASTSIRLHPRFMMGKLPYHKVDDASAWNSKLLVNGPHCELANLLSFAALKKRQGKQTRIKYHEGTMKCIAYAGVWSARHGY